MTFLMEIIPTISFLITFHLFYQFREVNVWFKTSCFSVSGNFGFFRCQQNKRENLLNFHLVRIHWEGVHIRRERSRKFKTSYLLYFYIVAQYPITSFGNKNAGSEQNRRTATITVVIFLKNIPFYISTVLIIFRSWSKICYNFVGLHRFCLQTISSLTKNINCSLCNWCKYLQ